MSRAALSVFVASIYLAVLGAALIVIPNTILTLTGFAPTSEVWIRLLGALVVVIGYIGFVASRSEALPVIRATLVTLPFLIVVMVALVVLGLSPPSLLLFAAVELVFLVWTSWALRAK